MMQKIALEEHFLTEEGATYLVDNETRISKDRLERVMTLVNRLKDLGAERLENMERAGIDVAVLSLAGPGAQGESDSAKASGFSRRSNEFLAEKVQQSKGRYAGFAHLPMQDVSSAIKEMEACKRVYGFPGCMINGHTLGSYLDEAQYDEFWAASAELTFPVYIHPTYSPALPAYADTLPELAGALWGWMAETGGHVMRLILSGVFERHPGASVILGHMGESIPFLIDRLDIGYNKLPSHKRTPHPPSYYIRRNLYVTTSGVPSTPALRCSMETMGPDRVMFATDYPFENCPAAGRWIDDVQLEAATKARIVRDNWLALVGRSDAQSTSIPVAKT